MYPFTKPAGHPNIFRRTADVPERASSKMRTSSGGQGAKRGFIFGDPLTAAAKGTPGHAG